jgi:hypothetical protein
MANQPDAVVCVRWSQPDSNRRPFGCKPNALPAELWPRTSECRRVVAEGVDQPGSVVEVEILGRLLLEPELIVLGSLLEEVRGLLQHVLVGAR